MMRLDYNGKQFIVRLLAYRIGSDWIIDDDDISLTFLAVKRAQVMGSGFENCFRLGFVCLEEKLPFSSYFIK